MSGAGNDERDPDALKYVRASSLRPGHVAVRASVERTVQAVTPNGSHTIVHYRDGTAEALPSRQMVWLVHW